MTLDSSVSCRRTKRRTAAFAGLAASVLGVAAAPAAADTRINATYDIRWLNLLSFGEANAVIDMARGGAYDANIRAKVFGTRAAITASGTVRGERVLPNSFAATISNGRRKMSIAMAMASGAVRRTQIEPQPKPRPDRIPLAAAHQRGIMDPLSAALMPVPRGGNELGPQSCNRTLPVFEGMERFDLQLSYSRMADAGASGSRAYNGQAVVCRVQYRPVAGHRTSADHVAYFKDDPLVEVWLAPIRGTNMLIPVRTSIPTPYGTLIVEAMKLDVDGADTADASATR